MRLIPSFAALAPFLILLGSCVGPGAERPGVGPVARPAATPPTAPTAARSARPTHVPQAQPAPVATEWQYRPVTPGVWRYRAEAAGSSAVFSAGAADALLTLRCDRASRRVSLARAGTGQGALVVRTSYGAASWPATASGGATPELVAFRAASDTGLDQLAYSRGKIAVEAAGQVPLIVPAWAEISRVIEDCRG